ncbi:MAG TPA: hypothetical protein EYQ61_12190 [Dehalococcoidia bacterium]|nr:hypothetical protein [Dehalococcoidia bacterium]HIK88171.1 hypothetical protein [Dehalococcoidia bacterium]
MTDSRDTTASNDDMDPRFENLAGYVLGALENDNERDLVEALIESDSEAHAEFSALAEAADMLAMAVPPVAPPAHLKTAIMEMAGKESDPTPVRSTAEIAPVPSPTPLWPAILRSGFATSAVAAVLVIVVAGVLGYQNNQLGNEIESLRAELTAESAVVSSIQNELLATVSESENKVASMKTEMETMETEFGDTTEMVVHQEEMVSELAIVNAALQQALADQSWLNYVAMREEYQVASWLKSTQPNPAKTVVDASGLIAIRYVGNEAVFQAHGLAQPQPSYAYTLWLLGNGAPQPVAQFEVSEIGAATVPFLLPAPFQLYSSVAVTQERVDGVGNDPTGTMVLSADTN